MRRLRSAETLRRLVRETMLCKDDLILPMFVRPGAGTRREISSMPGVYQFSVDMIVRECERVAKAGIPAILLFGIPEVKDELGTESCSERGIVQQAIRALKREIPSLCVITDVCLCEYTSHGHCGILDGETILNDSTIEVLAREAVSHAEAGADIVAPSDMMDGRVGTNGRRSMQTDFIKHRFFPMPPSMPQGFMSVP